jgi:acyl transferase domain-containing protein/acyl carrier protein
MDPQHRVFLQEAWHALEDAGHDPAQFPGSIGVFAGAGTSAYLENIFSNLDHGARIRGENVGLGFELGFLATRVSYKLDLRGPSMPVHTACSTSLVAVHNACQSLLDYECDMALAGAVAYKVRENTGYSFRDGGFLSPDGHVRPFDAGAGGTVFGSGVGVVVLRRLSDAVADGDVVWAVLRGSAVNNDGAVKVSFTAPSVSGQAAVVAAALESAGLSAGDIDYVEAHGTGTLIGDSIEVQALSRVFGGVAAGSVGLGSLKGNVGHLDAAAGMAGLLKVILALRAQVVPASLHFGRGNPEIDFESGPFRVVDRPWAWPRSAGRARRAGVSAFGFGGTNAHVIVEEAPLPVIGEPGAGAVCGAGGAGAAGERDGVVLVVSARSPQALGVVSGRLADAVEALAAGGAAGAGGGPAAVVRERRLLGDVAFTLGVGRRALECRRAVTGSDVASVVAALRSDPVVGPGSPVSGLAQRVVFVATGQGSQHCGMARALYVQEPVFAREFDRCAAWVAAADAELDAGQLPGAGGAGSGLAVQLREELARAGLPQGQVAGSAELAGVPGLDRPLSVSWPPQDLADLADLAVLGPGCGAGLAGGVVGGLGGGVDLRWVVLADPSAGGMWAPVAARLLERTCWAQPALWCVEFALARLWQSWGVVPQAVVGHSLGEWVAASLAGVFDLRSAARLVVARGRVMQRQPAGAMATVLADPDEVGALLAGPGLSGLSVAARNGPGECVVSGPAELVAAFGRVAARQGWGVQPVPGGHGFHSALMDAAVPVFRDCVARELAGRGGPADGGARELRVPFTSNVTGDWISVEQAFDPDYWAGHIRAGVRFADNIATVLDGQPDTVLLEIGPGRALTSLIRRTLTGRAGPDAGRAGHAALASLPHRDDTRTAAATVRQALADLWVRGLHPRWHDYYRHHPRQRIPLPTYPFQPTHHWLPTITLEYAGRVASAAAPVVSETEQHTERAEFADWFYVPTWQRNPLPPAPLSVSSNGHWLVFADVSGLGAALADRLRERGATVTVVRPVTSAATRSDGDVRLDITSSIDYEAMIASLCRDAGGRAPDKIVHCWGVDPLGADDPDDLGLYGLIRLAQALNRYADDVPRALWVLTTGLHDVTGDERLEPRKATVLGACRVWPRETAGLRCASIDVGAAKPTSRVLDQLLAEFDRMPSPPPTRLIALRGRHRWTLDYRAERVATADAPPEYIRTDGLYLITGGTGGIGLAVTEHLAGPGVKLLLLARTPMPPADTWDDWLAGHADDARADTVRRLTAVRAKGATVRVTAADVADREGVSAEVSAAVAEYGPVRGVVHAAGIAGGGLIELKDLAVATDVMRPKVAGTLVLDAVLTDHEPDFVVLFSSNGANIGSLGQVDYCAANCFLDAYAHHRANPRRVVAIDWGPWAETGMAVTTDLPLAMAEIRRQDIMKWGMSTAEGLRALDAILAGPPHPQVIVSPGRLSAVFARAMTAVPAAHSDDAPAAPLRSARPTGPQQESEIIAEVWQDMLGVDRVGENDSFFELGGDSLIAIQLTARLNERLGSRVTVADLFEQRTVANLATLVHRPGPGASTQPSPSFRAESLDQIDRRELLRKRREQQQRRTETRR